MIELGYDISERGFTIESFEELFLLFPRNSQVLTYPIYIGINYEI